MHVCKFYVGKFRIAYTCENLRSPTMAEMCDQISKISNNIEDKLGNCFWKIAGLDTFEINVQNSQIFEKIFRINSLSEQISEAEESDRFLSTAHDADEEITNSEEMFVLEEIQNFDAINSGFSGLEIRNKKKTKQTSITIFFSKK